MIIFELLKNLTEKWKCHSNNHWPTIKREKIKSEISLEVSYYPAHRNTIKFVFFLIVLNTSAKLSSTANSPIAYRFLELKKKNYFWSLPHKDLCCVLCNGRQQNEMKVFFSGTNIVIDTTTTRDPSSVFLVPFCYYLPAQISNGRFTLKHILTKTLWTKKRKTKMQED